MATSNISTQAEKDNLISSPDWGSEARVPNRALWEIAAIAGDVEPKLEKVNERKEADSEWKVEYEKRVRAMKTALLPTRSQLPDHVYYEPQLGGNATLIDDPKKFRQVRVDVVSAIEFLWHRFGKNVFPEGLNLIHQQLSTLTAGTVNQSSQDLISDPIASAENSGAIKGPSHRDQKLANATKELKRLQALTYVFSRELFSCKQDSELPPATLIDDWLASIDEAELKGREGFGRTGVQSHIEKCFKSYSELKRNP